MGGVTAGVVKKVHQNPAKVLCVKPDFDRAGRQVDASFLGALEPTEVLVDIDGPRLFVARTIDGDDLLVYQAAEADGRSGWIVVPTDARSVDRVREGESYYAAAGISLKSCVRRAPATPVSARARPSALRSAYKT